MERERKEARERERYEEIKCRKGGKRGNGKASIGR